MLFREKHRFGGKENTLSTKGIERIVKESARDLMSIPGVLGTGQGLCDGEPCIKVFVTKKTPELERRVPGNLGGHPVVIEETGEFRAFRGDRD